MPIFLLIYLQRKQPPFEGLRQTEPLGVYGFAFYAMVRFKNRYLLCAIEHDGLDQTLLKRISMRSILTAVRSSVELNFGDILSGTLQTALSVSSWSPELGVALIRTSRDHFRMVWSSISMISKLKGLPETVNVRLSVVHVGGTIRSCEKVALDYGRFKLRNEHNALLAKGDSTRMET